MAVKEVGEEMWDAQITNRIGGSMGLGARNIELEVLVHKQGSHGMGWQVLHEVRETEQQNYSYVSREIFLLWEIVLSMLFFHLQVEFSPSTVYLCCQSKIAERRTDSRTTAIAKPKNSI